MSSFPSAAMPGASASGLMGSTLPGAVRTPSAFGAWERLADERPEAASALQALFAALLTDAQHERVPSGMAAAHAVTDAMADTMPDVMPDTMPDVLADGLPDGMPNVMTASSAAVLPAGGESLPDERPDPAAAALPDFLAAAGAGSGAEPVGDSHRSASTAALIELAARGPQAQSEAAYQSWARDLLHRAETLMRTMDGGAAPLPAEMEALSLPLRLEQGAYGVIGGTTTGAPAQTAAATAVLAAMIRNTGETGVRGEAVPLSHADATAVDPAGTPAAVAAAAQAQHLPTGAGERALPAWSLNTPLQNPQWGEEVSERVRWMLGQQLQSAELKITPPQLGTIEVRISVHKDQMSVSFAAPNAAVREALEDAMPRLREMLSGSGYETVSVDISQHSLPQRRDTAPDGYAAAGRAADEHDETLVGVTALRPSGTLGVIDFYA